MRKILPICIKPVILFSLALALLLVPFQWITAWVFAAIFHELCHYAVLRLLGCSVYRIQIDLNGATMDTDLFGSKKEMLSALAGPVGSLLLILLGRRFPRLAICAFIQSAYNLIPIYPLDGGRAVRCVLRKIFSEKTSRRIELWSENCILLIFFFIGLYAALGLKIGLLPLVLSVILIMKNKQGKCTCKELPLGVK